MSERVFAFDTTSRFVGEYISEKIKIQHFWPDITGGDRDWGRKFLEGPDSQSYYIIKLIGFHREWIFGGSKITDDGTGLARSLVNMISVILGKELSYVGCVHDGVNFLNPISNQRQRGPYLRSPLSDHGERIDFPLQKLNIEHLSEYKVAMEMLFDDNNTLNEWLTAARFYARGINNFTSDPNLSFTDLVSCGECLTQDLKLPDSELYDDAFLPLIKKFQESKEFNDSEKSILQKKLYQLRRRFAFGILHDLDEGYFSRKLGGFTNDDALISKDNIFNLLGATYDVRSKLVHAGANLSVLLHHLPYEERLWMFNVGMDKDLKKVLRKSLSFIGLERVIRYSLIKRLKGIQEQYKLAKFQAISKNAHSRWLLRLKNGVAGDALEDWIQAERDLQPSQILRLE
jgi:hypothetical protein